MVSATRTARDLEVTAEALQRELQRLEMQRQSLERELAAVVAHLGSVQTALGALRDLLPPASSAAAAPQPATSVADSSDTDAPLGRANGRRRGDAVDEHRTADVAEPAREPSSVPSPSRPADSAGRPPAQPAETAEAADAGAGAQGNYGRLTEQILDYLASTGGAEVRARDVAAALGRDTDAGSINAVRSTLDRLVGASRVQRAGRGLYQAAS
ncbi:hypothetical protein [Streptomyces sp. NPDC026673]|uniref:hypothetical protein n=1 Tax=Streptomyces sp. NPDC026673 TaxID=3155724 RepID=UPI0033C1E076